MLCLSSFSTVEKCCHFLSVCLPKTLFAFSGFSLDCLLFLGKSFKFISGCTSCFLSDQFDSTIQFLILVFGSVDGAVEFPAGIKLPDYEYSKMIFSDFHISYLSPYGHQFISDIRSDNVWNHVKSLSQKVGSNSLSALIQISSGVITQLIKSQLGIT